MTQQSSQPVLDEDQVRSGHIQQFLTFVLNDEVYGIDILDIREILDYDNLTVVPLMPDFISGVINLRGNVVPVVNLARRFELQPKEIGKRTSIIIIDIKDSDEQSVEVGIIVDNVNEVIELASSDIAPAPTFGARIRTDFIQGMSKNTDKLMILLEVDHVLAINELSQFVEISDELNSSPTNQVSN